MNEYGTRLLNFCKASGLRILNGRDRHGYSNHFTCCGSNGVSVIDYLLLFPEIFPIIDKFIVCNVTEFSAHAPLHVQLVVTADLHTSNIPCVDDSIGHDRIVFK